LRFFIFVTGQFILNLQGFDLCHSLLVDINSATLNKNLASASLHTLHSRVKTACDEQEVARDSAHAK
jgi:hypothetical protein